MTEKQRFEFDLKEILGNDFWTPGGLSRLPHICFKGLSEEAIKKWMTKGIMLNDKRVTLRHLKSGTKFRTKPRWVILFLLAINSHLGE